MNEAYVLSIELKEIMYQLNENGDFKNLNSFLTRFSNEHWNTLLAQFDNFCPGYGCDREGLRFERSQLPSTEVEGL